MTKDHQKLNAALGVEFDRYVLEHPAWAQKHIPSGAKVVLQIEGNEAFNTWSREVATRSLNPSQPMVLVCIKKLAPVRSRIIKAAISNAA